LRVGPINLAEGLRFEPRIRFGQVRVASSISLHAICATSLTRSTMSCRLISWILLVPQRGMTSLRSRLAVRWPDRRSDSRSEMDVSTSFPDAMQHHQRVHARLRALWWCTADPGSSRGRRALCSELVKVPGLRRTTPLRHSASKTRERAFAAPRPGHGPWDNHQNLTRRPSRGQRPRAMLE
jgi:hypothetical protein